MTINSGKRKIKQNKIAWKETFKQSFSMGQTMKINFRVEKHNWADNKQTAFHHQNFCSSKLHELIWVLKYYFMNFYSSKKVKSEIQSVLQQLNQTGYFSKLYYHDFDTYYLYIEIHKKSHKPLSFEKPREKKPLKRPRK